MIFLTTKRGETSVFFCRKTILVCSCFQVADTASPANILPDQSLLISVRMKDNRGGLQADPAVAPGVRLGITVSHSKLTHLFSVVNPYKPGS